MAKNGTKYDSQRPKVTPPHVALADLRRAAGLTIDQLLERITDTTGNAFTRGAISAVENGHRGASPDLLRSLELAYGLDAGRIVTNYDPKPSRRAAA